MKNSFALEAANIENPKWEHIISRTAKEVVNKSEVLMKGNRGKLFFLEFSFIGWSILATFTFGIGFLWLVPYIQFAVFVFYDFVAKKDAKEETEVIVEESNQ